MESNARYYAKEAECEEEDEDADMGGLFDDDEGFGGGGGGGMECVVTKSAPLKKRMMAFKAEANDLIDLRKI